MKAKWIFAVAVGVALSAGVLADSVKAYEGIGKTSAEACGRATNLAGAGGLPSGASVGGCECSQTGNQFMPWLCIVRVTIRDK